MSKTLKLSWGVLFAVLAGLVPGALAWGAPPAYIPIAEARQQAVKTAVAVEGLVTVPCADFRSSSGDQGFAIQDQTGGIWISVKRNLHCRVGQRIRVSGTLQNDEKLEIAADPASVKTLPGKELRVATGHVGAATLGFLITVEGTLTQDVQKDLPDGYKVFIDDGTGPVQVYLNASTDIDPRAPYLKKGRTIRVTGFANKYGSTYEVDPRFQRDVQPVR
ncbi:MAG TPA: DNA-binding protein [Thermoanaerobaculia bacterium]|nr:DNA-binding protein [Thermoanaerobaculia bacterium]